LIYSKLFMRHQQHVMVDLIGQRFIKIHNAITLLLYLLSKKVINGWKSIVSFKCNHEGLFFILLVEMTEIMPEYES